MQMQKNKRMPGDPEAEAERPFIKARQYVICQGTSDYPGKVTVRKHLIFSGWTRPAELMGTADSLEEARKLVPDGFTRLPPQPGDDPVIVEVWI